MDREMTLETHLAWWLGMATGSSEGRDRGDATISSSGTISNRHEQNIQEQNAAEVVAGARESVVSEQKKSRG